MNSLSFHSDTVIVKRLLGTATFTALLLSFALGAREGFAQSNAPASQFGLVMGYSVPDAENTKPFQLYGVKGAAFLSPIFSFGGYYLLSDTSGQPSSSDKFSYSLHGIEAAYHFGGTNGDTFTGVRIGLTKVHQTPEGQNVTFSPYHWGVVSGHDFHVLSWLSLGFEGSYIHAQRGRTSVGTDRFERKSFNIISFLLTAQFRF
jgi:hypothetical protein